MKHTIELLKIMLFFMYLVTPSFFLCMWLAEKWPEIFSSGPIMAVITILCAAIQAAVTIDISNWLHGDKS